MTVSDDNPIMPNPLDQQYVLLHMQQGEFVAYGPFQLDLATELYDATQDKKAWWQIARLHTGMTVANAKE